MYELYVRLQKKAIAFARQQVGSDAADDVVQQAFLEVLEVCFANDDAPERAVDALFFRILRHRCVDWQRGVRRHVSAPDKQADSGVVELAVWVDNRSPALVADGSMLSARVDYVIETMPPEMQRVMRAARDIGWDKARAIADVTGMRYDLVKWHLKQGLERLRRQLEKDGYPVPAHLRIGRPAGSTKESAGGTIS